MKAAFITGPHQIPVYGDVPEPEPRQGFELIRVTASALSNATKVIAAGDHYSSSRVFPAVVGIDGIGYLHDDRRVYFTMPRAPFGAMAQWTLVARDQCVPIPDELDDVTAAAIVNPGLSSVAALGARARFLPGETVLVHGATGTAGRLAVQLAKYLGAGKVIATGRDAAALQHLRAIGADVTVDLTVPDETLQMVLVEHLAGEGIDVVLDYLYGPRAEFLLGAIAVGATPRRPIRYVVIGGGNDAQIALPSALLRAVPVTVMGSGPGSVSQADLLSAAATVVHAAVPAALRIETTSVELAEVSTTWPADTGRPRLVYRTGQPRSSRSPVVTARAARTGSTSRPKPRV